MLDRKRRRHHHTSGVNPIKGSLVFNSLTLRYFVISLRLNYSKIIIYIEATSHQGIL